MGDTGVVGRRVEDMAGEEQCTDAELECRSCKVACLLDEWELIPLEEDIVYHIAAARLEYCTTMSAVEVV